jgi:hypothetical protein
MRGKSGQPPEVIEHGDLVVRDNRIVALGRRNEIYLPADADTIDVSGMTIMPGYVDVHDHIAATYGVMAGVCWVCHTVLASGITTSRSAIDHELTYSSILALAERERAGNIVSPRIFATGVPHYRSDPPLRTLEDAREVSATVAAYFDTGTFKEYDGDATRQARQFIARATQEAGLNATVHVPSIEWGLAAFTDGFAGVEHPLSRSAPLYDDVLTFVAKTGTTQTMTYSIEVSPWQYLTRPSLMSAGLAKLERFVPPSARDSWLPLATLRRREAVDMSILRRTLSSAAGITRRGGRVGMGSHGVLPGLGFHHEMWLHALGGMPNAEILRSATIVGATSIGYGNALGSLEEGKRADLQILDRNPLQNIHYTLSIKYVMKNGRLYQTADLTEVWPRLRRGNATFALQGRAAEHPMIHGW